MFDRRPNSNQSRICVLGFSANRVWLVSRFYIWYIIIFLHYYNTNYAVRCSPMQSDTIRCLVEGRQYVRSSVRPSRNLRLYTAYKRLDLKAPNCAHVSTLTRYVHFSIFIQIIDVLDFHYQGQRFESNTFASSYVKSA